MTNYPGVITLSEKLTLKDSHFKAEIKIWTIVTMHKQ